MNGLLERWHTFLERTGDKWSCTDKSYGVLSETYSEPRRFYHTLEGHIAACIRELDSVFAANSPLAVEAALWTHDARRDETESIEWMKDFFRKLWLPESLIDEVGLLIEITRHTDLPHKMLFTKDGRKREYDYLLDTHAGIVADIDLSIFGKSEAEFDEYERLVRKEYPAVPENIFREKRANILERFLERKCIYNHRLFQEKYEIMARKNLTRSIGKLRSR